MAVTSVQHLWRKQLSSCAQSLQICDEAQRPETKSGIPCKMLLQTTYRMKMRKLTGHGSDGIWANCTRERCNPISSTARRPHNEVKKRAVDPDTAHRPAQRSMYIDVAVCGRQ